MSELLPPYRVSLAQALELLAEAAKRLTQQGDQTLRFKIEEFVKSN